MRLIYGTYKEGTGRITLYKKVINCQSEVSKNKCFRAKLFTACLEGLLRMHKREKTGLRINREYLNHLRYAYHAVLLCKSGEHTQTMLEALQLE